MLFSIFDFVCKFLFAAHAIAGDDYYDMLQQSSINKAG